mmetsp:Transcript_3484/g.10453  ORF Transcript_3484/g.10453 Transcript_3484/m.10453 type:complete len:122 (+) Transcript_3484:129-494(+)
MILALLFVTFIAAVANGFSAAAAAAVSDAADNGLTTAWFGTKGPTAKDGLTTAWFGSGATPPEPVPITLVCTEPDVKKCGSSCPECEDYLCECCPPGRILGNYVCTSMNGMHDSAEAPAPP